MHTIHASFKWITLDPSAPNFFSLKKTIKKLGYKYTVTSRGVDGGLYAPLKYYEIREWWHPTPPPQITEMVEEGLIKRRIDLSPEEREGTASIGTTYYNECPNKNISWGIS